jgi:16S rRNA (cytidine1402-2'-O)-methyltransferase
VRDATPGAGTGGTLYVVATPIGNLSDVTLRALEVLRSVPRIAAEDTRITSRLLARYAITTTLTSFHARSGPSRLETLLAHLQGGEDLALVTDAGTPVVSDPGADLVRAWSGAGGRVVPLPGASAVLAIVAATGIAGPRWTFEGFLPRSGRERRDRLAAIAGDARGAVLYEAPRRMAGTLRDLVAACGGNRVAAVGRELTKLHEQIVVDDLATLAAAATDGTIPARGEIVVLIGMRDAPDQPATGVGGIEAARVEVERLVDAGAARSEAARLVAGRTGFPRRQLYATSGSPGAATPGSGRRRKPAAVREGAAPPPERE